MTITTPAVEPIDLTEFIFPLPCDTLFIQTGQGCANEATWVASCPEPGCGHEDLACDDCYLIDRILNRGQGVTRCARCQKAIIPTYERIDL